MSDVSDSQSGLAVQDGSGEANAASVFKPEQVSVEIISNPNLSIKQEVSGDEGSLEVTTDSADRRKKDSDSGRLTKVSRREQFYRFIGIKFVLKSTCSTLKEFLGAKRVPPSSLLPSKKIEHHFIRSEEVSYLVVLAAAVVAIATIIYVVML